MRRRAGPAQAIALAAVSARELSWIMPGVALELGRWRERAMAMPPSPIREDALEAIDVKRLQSEGAALFAVIPRRRVPELLRLLVAYQQLWDFLDSVSERRCGREVVNGRHLHRALAEALDPDAPLSDYYRYHPWEDDGGYLRALVETCRQGCSALPSYELVQSRVIREAIRGSVEALNHDPDPAARNRQLQALARRDHPGEHELAWYELMGAASSSMAIHALLTLAADPRCDEAAVTATYAAYFPWVCAASAMLDSYADIPEDEASGDHSYIAHYASLEVAVKRVRAIVRLSLRHLRTLSRGERHALITAGMVAMYMSKDSTLSRELRGGARRILRAAGPLAILLWPIMRAWRLLSGQRAS